MYINVIIRNYNTKQGGKRDPHDGKVFRFHFKW